MNRVHTLLKFKKCVIFLKKVMQVQNGSDSAFFFVNYFYYFSEILPYQDLYRKIHCLN